MSYTWAFDKIPDMKWDTPVLARDCKTNALLSELETMRRWYREFEGKIIWLEASRYDNKKIWGSSQPRVTRVQRELIKYATDHEIRMEEQYVRNGLYDIGRGDFDDCDAELSEDEEFFKPSTSVKNEPMEEMETNHEVPKSISIEPRNVDKNELELYASNAFDCALQKYMWPHRFSIKFNSVPLNPMFFSQTNSRSNIQNRMVMTVYPDACEPYLYEHVYPDGTMWTMYHQWRVTKCHLRFMNRKKVNDRLRIRQYWSERDITNILDSY